VKLATLVLAAALLIGSIPAMGASVFVTTDNKAISTPYDSLLVTETVNYFTTKGFTVAESKEKADYIVTSQVSVNSSGGKFNIAGCLLCGLFGVVQQNANVSLVGAVTKNNAQIWISTVKSSDKGWFLFGIFQGSSSVVNSAVKSGVSDLFDSFIIQNK
jgi:hypothetical protein